MERRMILGILALFFLGKGKTDRLKHRRMTQARE